MYSNDDYGKGGYDSAVACADKYGVELVSDSFMGDDQNFSAQLTKIKDAGCEAILMWCQPTPASLIMKQASDMGWSPQYLCGPGVNDPRLFELSNGLCDKAILSTSFYADNPDEYVSAWVERYRQRWNMEPSLTASLGYDGMMIIFKGIEAAGSAEPKAIAEGILSLIHIFLEAIGEGSRLGKGAVSLHGKMIDAPVVKRALQIVEMENAMAGGGLVD